MDDNADQFCSELFPTRDTALVDDLNDDSDDFWKQFDTCTTVRPVHWCAFEIPVVQKRLQFCTISLRQLESQGLPLKPRARFGIKRPF